MNKLLTPLATTATFALPSASQANMPGPAELLLNHAIVQAKTISFVSGESKVFRDDTAAVLAAVPPSELPPPPPTQLGPFNAGNITFDNGVPVGGNMMLSLFQDGGFSFSGNFHDSGAPSYVIDCAWVIVSNSGKAFTFGIRGEVHGLFEAGPRDFPFAQNGKKDEIRDAWADLCAGYHWQWKVYVNWNVTAAVNSVVDGLKSAGVVIAAVVAVVAIL